MENYIVRIYRRDQNNPMQITGIVESVEQGVNTPFKNIEALNKLLLRSSQSSLDTDANVNSIPGKAAEI